MVNFNKDAVNYAIRVNGEAASLKHYTGDETYDANQNPTRSSTTTTIKPQIASPTKLDIENGYGKISADDKKFVIYGDVTVDKDDEITITSTGKLYKVHQINIQRVGGVISKSDAFASLIE